MQRREFVLGSAGVGVTAVAGCLDAVPGLGGSGPGSFDDIVAWLPEPSALSGELNHYSVSATTPAEIADQIKEPLFENNYRPNPPYANPTARDVEYSIEAESTVADVSVNFQIYVGSFNVEWVEQRLRNDDGITSEGNHEEFQVYSTDSQAYAVSEDAYVVTEEANFLEESEPVAVAETIIDTSVGDVDTYADASDNMDVLADAIPSGHELAGETFEPVEGSEPANGQLERLVARGSSSTLDGNVTKAATVLVFEDETDVRERDLEEFAQESGEFSEYRDTPEISTDGRVATIEGQRPT